MAFFFFCCTGPRLHRLRLIVIIAFKYNSHSDVNALAKVKCTNPNLHISGNKENSSKNSNIQNKAISKKQLLPWLRYRLSNKATVKILAVYLQNLQHESMNNAPNNIKYYIN